MSAERFGILTGINGNMARVEFEDYVMQNEVAFILHNEERLKSEVIRVAGNIAELQIYEDTKGLKLGEKVEFTGELLSVKLGPGLLGQIFDGLQNPLPQLAEKSGFFLKRGLYLEALDDKAEWEFTPVAKSGQSVKPGEKIGFTKEGIFEHWIMAPFGLKNAATVVKIANKGKYNIKHAVAELKDERGNTSSVTMAQTWPVKVPIASFAEKLKPSKPLVTKIRVIDTLMPVALGGTYCVPGPFGSGKTVLQQLISKHAEIDIVIIAACGERAGEVVETLREFPDLVDPRTKKSLMERTVIICNTSSMPVSARESSVYTAVTIAEYYRQMGLNVLLLADSTSRWAQAMREMSGRLEEIPGEEAFPAYLESRIASFYERAGLVRLHDGSFGSVTIGGTVSPAGGNFEEPVTQATLKVVGAFHGLSRERSDARRYPAIDPLESWSKYTSFIDREEVNRAQAVLKRSYEIKQMMKVVGEEGASLSDFTVYLKGEFIDDVYLQQNAFDEVDAATIEERQKYVFHVLHEIMDAEFNFENKDGARRFFQELRQAFIEWNSSEWQTENFKKQESQIKEKCKKYITA
ncbi:MAG: V-type ATP synthase subunit A [Candidatus Omnitrophica bacterium CG22_combo_CG10-13_8_21_14_all_43_16]|nr:MAG: V-type ATP synthase subunit A [Candidatus Omnitrophica bacterium CG22_combo_CG10-13_8_21_14_all_43_16]